MALSVASAIWPILVWSAIGVALPVLGYVLYIGTTWVRFGRMRRSARGPTDALLDRVMPEYDVAECHRVRVAAPAAAVLSTAMSVDLMASPPVRVLIRLREWLLGADADTAERPRALLPLMQSLGWGILAEDPGHEIIAGAVTQPWQANVVFNALPADEFVRYDQPGYVKIVWTLRVDPAGADLTWFRTETRVAATDADARARFRWYWAVFSPGIVVIRWALLALLKREAERRTRQTSARTVE